VYYYGARYYDPRISIFVSVDPLAEQTMEPYLYTGNNPIMFTDPTGMSKVDGEGGPGDDKKVHRNVIININSTSDFNKSELDEAGWHVIDANNIIDARNQLSNYLGKSNKLDNLYLNTHGGIDTNANSVNNSSVNLGKNNDLFTTDLSNKLSEKPITDKVDRNISALVSLANKVEKGGNFIFGSCNTGKNEKFGSFISYMDGFKDKNVYVNADISQFSSGMTKQISSNQFFNKQTPQNEFRSGWSQFLNGDNKRRRFNLEMTKTGPKK
jgi:uncharacterized protein RhaS with RHS repeats